MSGVVAFLSSPAQRGRGTAGPQVRGWRGRKGDLHKALSHVLNVPQHVDCRNPDDSVAKASHVFVPAPIALNFAVLSVARAIDLDH